MAIPESTLSGWSHHRSGTAPAQANVVIRSALDNYRWPQETRYKVFLQGSYQNATNLSGDSDIDVVIQLASRMRPKVAALSPTELEASDVHQFALKRWRSFHQHALRAMRAEFGDSVTSGRKSLKVAKGKIPASADVVVTLKHEDGLALFVPDARRWVVSYPQRHHRQGMKKERAAGNRSKRTVRMFKAARNYLVANGILNQRDAPSYFVECLLYNVPDGLFSQRLITTYVDILEWLAGSQSRDFVTQSEKMILFGPRQEQWRPDQARRFIVILQQLWQGWH